MKSQLRSGTIKFLYLLLIIFSVASLNVYGQNDVSTSDSLLQARLKNAKTNNDSISAYIFMFKRSRPPKDKVNKYVKEADNLIQSQTKDTTRCQLYISIENCYSSMNYIKEATYYLDKTLRIAEANNDSLNISRAYYVLGRTNYYQGDMNLATQYLMKNSQYFPAGVNSEAKIRSTIALAPVYDETKRYKLADSVYRLTVKVLENCFIVN